MTSETQHVAADPQGLSSAEVAERVAAGQVNVVQETTSRTTAEIVRANVVTRFNILLGVLLLIILIVVREPRDGLFGIVLVSNAAIGIIQELRAKRTLDRLALLTAPMASVLRDGRQVQIPVDQIVKDDLIALATGDQVPVDGPVTRARGLEIDESLLTGESDPVVKDEGDTCLSGSFVVAGSGWFQAERVGEEAYAAALAKEAKQFTLVNSELRDGVNWIIGGVSWIVGPMIALLLWSQMRLEDDSVGWINALSSGVAGAVGMIPQGLVLLTSLAFAVGVVRLGRRNVLVQELPAIEGLARVDTVCFDKTGTLTEGTLAVRDLIPLSDLDPEAALAAMVAAEPEPNATLQAIADRFAAENPWRADGAVPFSSARKWSAASFGDRGTWVLGAPEIVLPRNARVSAQAEALAEEGNRVVLLAWTDYPLSGDTLPRQLQPAAFVTLGDKIRDDAAATLRFFAAQGVQAKVISGDHPETVAAIAREVGVPGSAEAIDARMLPQDPEAFADVIEQGTVFGRVTPHQKRAMVQALQSRGHVVAMTGDGVNDVLALKDADIGVAIGSGSAASRAVAQLVLIDGEFSTLPNVVAEGRKVISNIERVANLFVTKTVYAIFIALAIGLIGRPFPFLPRHLTLVGSITIGVPAFFLALAPTADRARPGFVRRVLTFSLPTGLAAGFATYAAYEMALAEEVTLQEARTTATLVLAAVGLFALAIVSRPLLPWKKILIGSMIAFLILLLISGSSQDFFELNLPRAVVLVAAIGVVAITGSVMMFTLRAVGWARQVPLYLREHPPNVTATWTDLRQRITDTWSADDEDTGMIERYRTWQPERLTTAEIAALPAEADPDPPPPEDFDTLEWFNTDDILEED
ncbi:MAG: HAD-IC family P-type ATPase [Acidimicrobiia bacterium]|nr:HAD-IC family P-type ATPase [Acidimicrobiia bacterium]